MTKFKFSVIIPIYNSQTYLEQSIKSVINQTIGFKNNIELILVNDGSTDNSEQICLKYKEKYPNNIIYIKQKNNGVSNARNNGLKYAQGEFINFLDSDDIWEKNTFKNVYDFFEKNKNEINLVACKIKYFDNKKEFHPLNYKFQNNKIIDISKENDYIQLNGPTVFVKRLAANKIQFDDKLKYGEDPFWVNQIIISDGKYGVINNGLYLYRKRKDSYSISDNVNENYYKYFTKYYLKEIYKYTLEMNKDAIKYTKNLILYELYWKINMPISNEIDDKIRINYLNDINDLINLIDDEIIINNKIIPLNYKIYFLNKKKNKINLNNIIRNTNNLFYDLIFRNMRINNNKLIIHGKIPSISNDIIPKFELKDSLSNKIYTPKISEVKNWDVYSCFNELIYKTYLFRFEIDLINKSYKFVPQISVDNSLINPNIIIQLENKFNSKLNDYFKENNYIISKLNNSIVIKKKNIINTLKTNNTYLKSVIKTKKIKEPIKKILRPIYNLYRKIGIKNIILFESNPDFTDNAKMIFDYMIKNKVNDKYELIWLVKNKDDFKDIHIKNVKFVNFFLKGTKRSKEADYYYKHAKIILDANKYVKKAYPSQIRIHLNHGSPFKDASHYNLNIGNVNHIIVQSSFFVPVEAKVRDIDEDKILPLGFPRNDVLYSKEKKKFDLIDKLNTKTIFWLPTYRNHIMVGKNISSLKYGLACINNEKELIKLNDTLKKDNVTLIIKFHPVENTEAIEKCNLSNIIIIKNEDITSKGLNLYDVFNKVDALITDYSSVYFDFCLTKKNIGLAISDYDEYVKEQGDFQYEYKDAIKGNYMYNINDLIEFVHDVANNKDRTYKERMKVVDKYDDYKDGKSTQRVYDLIKKYL